MKNKFLFLASLLFTLILLAGCGEKSVTESYTEYLKNFADSSSEVYYLIRDIDNDGTKDLILSNNASLTIYTYTDSVKEIGSYDFITGTVQYLYSDNKDFPGIFYTTTGGGYNHYGRFMERGFFRNFGRKEQNRRPFEKQSSCRRIEIRIAKRAENKF